MLLDLLPESRQRIDLLAPPFAGHLHPILCIGRILATRHEIRVVSTVSALPRIEAAGLEGLALMGSQETELLSIANPLYAVGSNPLKLYRQFKAVLALLGQFRNELIELYRKTQCPNLMIADFTLPVAGPIAASLDLQWWTSLPSPCVLETKDGPPAYCGGLKPAANWRDRWSHRFARAKVRFFKHAIFWLFRQPLHRLGFAQLYRADGSEATYSPVRILALGDESFEFKRSWPASICFLGPMLYTPPLPIPPPRFETGRRHVLITLGTHLAWHKDAVALAAERLARTRSEWIFHFTDGSPDSKTQSVIQNFHRVAFVDYDQHIHRYDAVIHHGGAGILYHCLQHNIPSLIYPVDYDQFDHAARIEVAGKGIWLRGGLKSIEAAGSLLDRLIQSKSDCREHHSDVADL